MNAIHASGRRKRAVARATLLSGNGVVRINSHLLQWYEPELYRHKLEEPFLLAGELAKKVDVSVRVHGGGAASQADAARLAIARCLSTVESSLQQTFLKYDRTLLVADVRRKETHKPNCHGKARAMRQKSYR